MSKEEVIINAEALRLAYMEKTLESMAKLNRAMSLLIEAVRLQGLKSNIHIKYEIDLSVEHSNYEVADFNKINFEVSSLTVLPVPSAMSIRLRGIEDDYINLSEKGNITITDHEITRLLVTNSAGSGTAEIHVFGRFKEKIPIL